MSKTRHDETMTDFEKRDLDVERTGLIGTGLEKRGEDLPAIIDADRILTVYQGKQPKYSGDKDSCDAVAGKLRGDAIAQGTTLTVDEHRIEIR